MKHCLLFSFRVLFALSVLCGPTATPAQAQNARASVNEAIPITVNADTMSYEPDKDRVVFQGNVEVTRARFVMWANQLTLHMKPADRTARPAENTEGDPSLLQPGLDPGSLDRIVAEKNVRFRYNTQNGTASKATYTIDTGVLVLEGDPVLRDGENSISGDVIRYFLNENRSEVDSGPQRRVEAVFGSASLSGKN